MSLDPSLKPLFDEFEAYPFSEDADFRAGLPTVIAAIKASRRGKDRGAAQVDEMIGRAQWFYFTRQKSLSIPWELYSAYAARPRSAYVMPSEAPFSSPPSTMTISPTSHIYPQQLSANAASTSPHSHVRGLAALNDLVEARKVMSGVGPLAQPSIPPAVDMGVVPSNGLHHAGAGAGTGVGAIEGLPTGQMQMQRNGVTTAAGTIPHGENADVYSGLDLSTLMTLISQGRAAEVPVKQIPEGVNELPASTATMASRPKPWEGNVQVVQDDQIPLSLPSQAQ